MRSSVVIFLYIYTIKDQDSTKNVLQACQHPTLPKLVNFIIASFQYQAISELEAFSL